MTELLPLLVVIMGILFMVLLFFQKWPGWVGFPFLIIILWTTINAGISPLVEASSRERLSATVRFMGISNFRNYELPNAIALVVLSYCTLLFGMFIAYVISIKLLGRRSAYPNNDSILKGRVPPDTTDRMWRVSLTIFSIGVLCFAIIIYKMVQSAPILEWSSHRTEIIFPREGHSGIYEYAFSLYGIMQIGAWGLLLFSASNRARRKVAMAANLLFPIIQIVLGSRFIFITSIYAIVMVYHFGVRPLQKRHWLGILFVGLIGLFMLSLYRYDFNQLRGAVQNVEETLLVPRSINEPVWALRNWPNRFAFFGGKTTLHGLKLMFPTARLVQTQSTWDYIVQFFYKGRPPGDFSKGGGVHFGFPVEQYIDLGYIGVVFIGLIYGLFFGGLYEWQARRRNNPFLLLLSVSATVTLLTGLEGKMPRAIGEFFSFQLLPIGFIALVSINKIGLLKSSCGSRHHWHARLLASLYFIIVCFLLRALTGSTIFNYFIVFFLSLSYISSFFIIKGAGVRRLKCR